MPRRNVLFDAILMIGIAMHKFDDYVIDVLMRDLVGHDRRPTSFSCISGSLQSRHGEMGRSR